MSENSFAHCEQYTVNEMNVNAHTIFIYFDGHWAHTSIIIDTTPHTNTIEGANADELQNRNQVEFLSGRPVCTRRFGVEQHGTFIINYFGVTMYTNDKFDYLIRTSVW